MEIPFVFINSPLLKSFWQKAKIDRAASSVSQEQ